MAIAVAPEAAKLRGLVIARDGAQISSAMWGSAIPVDPGRHLVEASAPGYRKWATTVESSRDGGTTTVRVPSLFSNDAPMGPVAAPPVVPPRPSSTTVASAASVAPATSSAPAGDPLELGVAPVPESSASPAVVRLAPPANASHSWSLRNRDGTMVCALPCTRRVRADAGMYVQLDDGSDSETLALNDNVVQAGPAPLDLHVDPGRGGRAAGITLTVFGLVGATIGGIVWGAGASMQPDPKRQGESYDADFKSNKDTADGVERVGMIITLVGAAALLPGIIVWAQAQRPRITGAAPETPREPEPTREVSIGPGFLYGKFLSDNFASVQHRPLTSPCLCCCRISADTWRQPQRSASWPDGLRETFGLDRNSRAAAHKATDAFTLDREPQHIGALRDLTALGVGSRERDGEIHDALRGRGLEEGARPIRSPGLGIADHQSVLSLASHDGRARRGGKGTRGFQSPLEHGQPLGGIVAALELSEPQSCISVCLVVRRRILRHPRTRPALQAPASTDPFGRRLRTTHRTRGRRAG